MEKERLLEDDIESSSNRSSIHRQGFSSYSNTISKTCKFVSVLLVFSLCLNIFLTWRLSQYLPDGAPTVSEYAQLSRDLTEPYYLKTPYSSPNDTIAYDLWHSINIDLGVIALSDSYVASKKALPSAQRFPWDETKGIYILHGYHNLHCLKIIYISMLEHRRGEPQSRKWPHISHCFDALRRQVLCDADDTPRATQVGMDGVSGVGQERKCKSWAQLEEWAKRHTACYRRPERPVEGMRNIEKYKHCPEGSGYVVRQDVF